MFIKSFFIKVYQLVFINQKEKDVRDNSTFNVTVNVLKAGDWFGVYNVIS